MSGDATRERKLGTRAALRPPLLVGGVAALGVGLLALRSPHQPGAWGICPLFALTGTFCAGCGALRATYDLVHLDIAGAWGMNPLWVILVPVLIVGWVVWMVRAWRRRAQGSVLMVPTPTALQASLIVGAIIGYSILRNVPAFAAVLAP